MFGSYDTQPVGVAREGVNLRLYYGIKPIRWSESYQIIAQNQDQWVVYGDDRPILSYKSGIYTTRCKICRRIDAQLQTSSDLAVFDHFIHCALEHDYTLPADYVKILPDDELLQQAITKSHLYGLPMPGYDTHITCLKQEIEEKSICVLHNLQGKWYLKGRTHWLGYL